MIPLASSTIPTHGQTALHGRAVSGATATPVHGYEVIRADSVTGGLAASGRTEAS